MGGATVLESCCNLMYTLHSRFFHLPSTKDIAPKNPNEQIPSFHPHENPPLLQLPRLDSGELLVSTTLLCLGSSLSVEHIVPPPKAGCVVADELFVVRVMVSCAGPKRQNVTKAPWEIIARMRVNCLEETKGDPDVHGEEVQFARDGADGNRGPNDT